MKKAKTGKGDKARTSTRSKTTVYEEPSSSSASRRGAAKENSAGADALANRSEVIVEGRPVAGSRKVRSRVVQPTVTKQKKEGTKPVRVKAIRVGEYGHKRRRIGEVFDMLVEGDLPSWVILLKDAEPGQDEGTRGLHSGGREDDDIREERGVSKSKASKIADPTIVNDALPLGEGGNERKPAGGDDHVI